MPKNIKTFFAEIRAFSESEALRTKDLSDEKISESFELTLARATDVVEKYDGDLNEINPEFGLTPLQFCCLLGVASVATALILKDANPDALGLFEATAESTAKKEGRVEMVALVRGARGFKKRSTTDEGIEEIKLFGLRAMIDEARRTYPEFAAARTAGEESEKGAATAAAAPSGADTATPRIEEMPSVDVATASAAHVVPMEIGAEAVASR
jgi:hypothetical protein